MPDKEAENHNRHTERESPTHPVPTEHPEYEIPHEELVERFRTAIAEEAARYQDSLTAEQIIHSKLNLYDHLEHQFYYPLARAFDAIAYERYPLLSKERWYARDDAQQYCMRTSSTVVKLTNPVQVRVLDALTEAVGIPHEKGQTEIPVPPKLQHYQNYLDSPEFAYRLALAEARKKRRQGHS